MHRSTPRFLALLLVTLVALFGCSQQSDTPVQPADQQPLLSMSHPAVVNALDVQKSHTPRLMSKPGVVGTAVGATDEGEPAILVLLETPDAGASIAASLDGVPVRKLVTGPITAYKKPPTPPEVDHKARQDRPIFLGVSGGNVNDLANGYCCSGTLGALVTGGNKQYILSNSHVFAGDIASSPGDPDVSEIGDPINQPGLIDIYCQNVANDYVAHLSTLSSLTGNTNVDCAIAEVISGAVRTDGAILAIGTISSATVDAAVNQPVKKSGRTTGLTRSKVSGLNATVNVGYTDECAGNSFVVQYTGQILVTNRANKFLNSGDSGSLMVEDVDTNPRAVGLLFAGGGGIAVANPIDDVLSHLGVSMVGN